MTLGQVVFLPSAIRVTSTPTALGAPVTAGGTVLEATSTTPIVTVELEPARQTEVTPGDPVSIILPNNSTTDGVVWSVGTVATSAGEEGAEPTIKVEVALTDPSVAGSLDEAPVLVAITTATVENAVGRTRHRAALARRRRLRRRGPRRRRPASSGARHPRTVRRRPRRRRGHEHRAARRPAGGGAGVMSIDVDHPALASFPARRRQRHRRRPPPGRPEQPLLELDGVTKIYPTEPPVTALRH